MSRLCFSKCLLIPAISCALVAVPAHADMRVLDSNVPRFPRDMQIEGKSIDSLHSGEWVKVLIIEENKTQIFQGATPPWRRPGFGTRGPNGD